MRSRSFYINTKLRDEIFGLIMQFCLKKNDIVFVFASDFSSCITSVALLVSPLRFQTSPNKEIITERLSFSLKLGFFCCLPAPFSSSPTFCSDENDGSALCYLSWLLGTTTVRERVITEDFFLMYENIWWSFNLYIAIDVHCIFLMKISVDSWTLLGVLNRYSEVSVVR